MFRRCILLVSSVVLVSGAVVFLIAPAAWVSDWLGQGSVAGAYLYIAYVAAVKALFPENKV